MSDIRESLDDRRTAAREGRTVPAQPPETTTADSATDAAERLRLRARPRAAEKTATESRSTASVSQDAGAPVTGTWARSDTDRMRVHFDITHPAHVHLFKHAILELARNGHAVGVTSREKELTTQLLDAYGIQHTILSTRGDSPLALGLEWSLREVRTYRYARKFDPDVVVSRMNPPAPHAARLTGAKSIVFNDHEQGHGLARATAPFIDYFCTPTRYSGDLGTRHRRYAGFHELAYLHPNWFAPDHELLRSYGVDPDERYFVLRFVSMQAHHDIGRAGLSLRAKKRLIQTLSEHGRVYISNEGALPPAFDAYRLPVPAEAIHHLLAEASMCVTDSNTMATEAALLGTPTIRSNSFADDESLGNFVELDDYGLVVSLSDEREVLATVERLVDDADADGRWRRRRDRLLEDKIDVTKYILDRITEVGFDAR
ncbi:DUF354 domain-containing protein (plasmid) [Haloferacaceae archaeon DSL9]